MTTSELRDVELHITQYLRCGPLSRPLVAKRDFREADSGDNPTLTNRIAAAPSGRLSQ